jgi:hypothetical protein
MESVVTWALGALFVLIIAAALSVLFAFPVMWLWNALLPELFGLKTITWIQALGLVALIQLLAPKNTSSSSK